MSLSQSRASLQSYSSRLLDSCKIKHITALSLTKASSWVLLDCIPTFLHASCSMEMPAACRQLQFPLADATWPNLLAAHVCFMFRSSSYTGSSWNGKTTQLKCDAGRREREQPHSVTHIVFGWKRKKKVFWHTYWVREMSKLVSSTKSHGLSRTLALLDVGHTDPLSSTFAFATSCIRHQLAFCICKPLLIHIPNLAIG